MLITTSGLLSDINSPDHARKRDMNVNPVFKTSSFGLGKSFGSITPLSGIHFKVE